VTSTAYNPTTNGLAEAFNKIIIKLLKKFLFKRDWNEKLPNDGPNSYRQHTFSLVHRCKAVIPLEIQISSLHIALATKMTEEDNDQLRLQKLEALDKK